MDTFHRVHLQVVPSPAVRPHEVADPAREERIARRLQADLLLRDPVMAGALPDLDGFVLLDGTNRQRALTGLGFPWLLAQIIDYADEHAVQLRTWCHHVHRDPSSIISRAARLQSIRVVPLAALAAADALRSHATLAVVLDREQQFALERVPETSRSRAELLVDFVSDYEEDMVRVDCGAEDVEERAQSLSTGCLVAFPAFNRSQVVTMALRDTRIPAGITRHVIRCGRALRVNMPLSLLSPDLSLEEANAALKQHLEGLQPRLYREPTILYDS